MELADAYEAEAPLCSFVRTCAFSGASVEITDALRLSEKTSVQFRFLTNARPVLLSPGKVSLPEGMTLSFDPALGFEAEEVETESYNPKGSFDTDALWQIRLSTEIEEGKFVFTIE